MDFTKYFRQYEDLVLNIEKTCEKVKRDFNDCVTCKPGCSDCCHALFDLTLVEALYIRKKFDEKLSGKRRHEIITYANEADRKIFKIKKDATAAEKMGVDGQKIIERISKEKIKCPFLNETNLCILYDHRPIACRVYGIPTSAGGVGHTCGHSGFKAGTTYPTLNMDIVYGRLYVISNELVRDMKSKYKKMGDILVPISMCLITDYNDEFFGIEPLEIIK